MKKLILASSILIVSAVFVRAQDSTAPKIPFDGIETNWQNGSDRRDSSEFHGKYYIPTIMVDVNYAHSFNKPDGNTVVGSTALARNNEIQLSQLSFEGDFSYEGARARFLMQLGTRTQVVPRNDLSPYRGQYKLADGYRYLSEAYIGYIILTSGMALMWMRDFSCLI